MRLYARLQLHLARSEHFYWNSKFVGNKKCDNSCVKNNSQRQIDRWTLFLKLSNVIRFTHARPPRVSQYWGGRERWAMWFQKKILQENISGENSFTDSEAGKKIVCSWWWWSAFKLIYWFVNSIEAWFNLQYRIQSCMIKPQFTDTHLIRTARYHTRQFALSTGKESSYISLNSTRFTGTPLIRVLSMTP